MVKETQSPLLSLLRKMLFFSPFVFPLYLIRFKVIGIPFTVVEAYSYVLFALYFVVLLSGKLKLMWKKPARWYYYAVFVLILGATLGVITAPHFIALPDGTLMDSQMVALGVWKGWLFAPVLYFFVLTQTLRTSDDVRKLLIYFIYSSALVALVSHGLAVFADGLTYDFRLSGFFESANYLSLYIVPGLLMSVYYLLHDGAKSRRAELLNLASLTVMTHTLFLTQSYAAIIAVFGALVLYVLIMLLRQGGVKKFLIVSAVLLISFVAVVGSQLNSPKFKQFLDWENRSSTSVRLEIYEVAYGLVSDYPLTGVGPGLFQGFYQTKGPAILEQAPMEWDIPHPHNIFFAFWLNAGLLGFLAFLSIFLFVHHKFTYPILAFWGILIHGLFDTPFWKNDLAMIFWLIVAAILILQTHGINSSQKRKNPIRKRATIRVSASAKAKRI